MSLFKKVLIFVVPFLLGLIPLFWYSTLQPELVDRNSIIVLKGQIARLDTQIDEFDTHTPEVMVEERKEVADLVYQFDQHERTRLESVLRKALTGGYATNEAYDKAFQDLFDVLDFEVANGLMSPLKPVGGKAKKVTIDELKVGLNAEINQFLISLKYHIDSGPILSRAIRGTYNDHRFWDVHLDVSGLDGE